MEDPSRIMPLLRIVGRKQAPRNRGGAEEYQLTLTFRWPSGHTMSFVSKDTAPASTLQQTILPALQEKFFVEALGVPAVVAIDHREILATPQYVRVVA